MAITPEGRVKSKVDKLLKAHGAYFYKPVTGGYGTNSLDYVCCLRGYFFAVETKAPGKKPTRLQEHVTERMRAAGGKVFVVIGDEGLEALEEWLGYISNQ